MADSRFIFFDNDLELIDGSLDRIMQASDLADPRVLQVADVQLRVEALEEKLLSLKAAVAKYDDGGQEGGMNVVVPLGEAVVATGESMPRKRRASLVAKMNPEKMQDNIDDMPVSAIKHKSWWQATREDIEELADQRLVEERD